jgi:hypothetical protein
MNKLLRVIAFSIVIAITLSTLTACSTNKPHFTLDDSPELLDISSELPSHEVYPDCIESSSLFGMDGHGPTYFVGNQPISLTLWLVDTETSKKVTVQSFMNEIEEYPISDAVKPLDIFGAEVMEFRWDNTEDQMSYHTIAIKYKRVYIDLWTACALSEPNPVLLKPLANVIVDRLNAYDMN